MSTETERQEWQALERELEGQAPDFVRLTIELVHYGMGQWEWQLSYRFMLAAFNNLTSN